MPSRVPSYKRDEYVWANGALVLRTASLKTGSKGQEAGKLKDGEGLRRGSRLGL